MNPTVARAALFGVLAVVVVELFRLMRRLEELNLLLDGHLVDHEEVPAP